MSVILLSVKNSVFCLINLLVMAVAANFFSVSRRLPSLVLIAISLILLTANCDALLKPLMMIWELTPCSTWSLTSFKISPARTTTEVVPSPTSASCDRAMSTRIRAAGWTISRSFADMLAYGLFMPSRMSYMTRCVKSFGVASNLHDGGAVVGDGLLAILINHQQVPAVRT